MTSLLSQDRLNVIDKCAKQVAHLEGSTAELGVYQGGSAAVIASALPHKTLHLFDTFTGIPIKGEHDKHNIGDFNNTSLDAVKALLKPHSVQFHVGLFPSTTAGLEDNYCFIHVDADQYQSTKDALEYFYPRLTKGGIMVFDDWQWPQCPGVEKAINEFFQGKPDTLISEAKYQLTMTKQ